MWPGTAEPEDITVGEDDIEVDVAVGDTKLEEGLILFHVSNVKTEERSRGAGGSGASSNNGGDVPEVGSQVQGTELG